MVPTDAISWGALAVVVGGALMSTFAPSLLPEKWHPFAFYVGILLVCLGATTFFARLSFGQRLAEAGIPKIVIIICAFGLASAFIWQFLGSSNTSKSVPVGEHPLSIIDPGPQLIRTIRLSREGGGDKVVYRNVFLLGVQNTSPELKTIRSVQLKFWLLDAPSNCKISGSDQTSVDLNPSDVAYFEIGYIDSRERFYMEKEFKTLQPKEFDEVYHKAGIGLFRLGTGEGDSTINFILSQMDETGESTPTTFPTTFQFSADDMAPLFFEIVVHRDADHEVRLERRPSKIHR